MGTLSLILGISLIVLSFGIIAFSLFYPTPELKDWFMGIFGSLIFAIPMIIIGAIFIRRYDKDKKKL